MPYTLRKLPNQNKYRVRNSQTGEVRAHATTLAKAKAQVRLLNAVEHGFKPTRRRSSRRKSRASKK